MVLVVASILVVLVVLAELHKEYRLGIAAHHRIDRRLEHRDLAREADAERQHDDFGAECLDSIQRIVERPGPDVPGRAGRHPYPR